MYLFTLSQGRVKVIGNRLTFSSSHEAGEYGATQSRRLEAMGYKVVQEGTKDDEEAYREAIEDA